CEWPSSLPAPCIWPFLLPPRPRAQGRLQAAKQQGKRDKVSGGIGISSAPVLEESPLPDNPNLRYNNLGKSLQLFTRILLKDAEREIGRSQIEFVTFAHCRRQVAELLR